jgi:hypothetical protein
MWSDFLARQRSGQVIHKLDHYLAVYERHLANLKNKTLTFFEIGVEHGNSLQMWQSFLGPFVRVVGVDINPACKAYENTNRGGGTYIRTGDQSDVLFLKKLVDEFGPPDVVLDDGSHLMPHIQKTFDCLYPLLPKNGVYIVEDLHAAYWPEYGGGVTKGRASDDTFIAFAKNRVDALNAYHSRGCIQPDAFSDETFAISFYDSMVVFEKGRINRC